MKKVIILVSLILLLLAGINSYSQEPSPPATKGQVQPRKFNSESSANSNINTNDNNNSTPKTLSPINKINTHSSNAEPQNANKENGNSQERAVKNDPISEIIASEALVNLLARKGIITKEELLEEIMKVQESLSKVET